MNVLLRRAVLFSVLACALLFSATAQATYYSSGYQAYSYYSYSRSAQYYRWAAHQSHQRYRPYYWYSYKYWQPNKKPKARNDYYKVEVGDTIMQNVVSDNDRQGDGVATVSLVSGSLPVGVSLSTDGALTGTASESGIYHVIYRLTDEDGDKSKAWLKLQVNEEVAYCPQPALSDELHGGNSTHAIWVPGISENLEFVGKPVATRTLPRGNLVVTGVVADGDNEFDVELNYSRFTAWSNSPKLELNSSAYVKNGGSINPQLWGFYKHFSATLKGKSGAWSGVELSATLRGPKAQLGFGANGKNKNFGLANWFDLTIDQADGDLPDGYYIGQSLIGDVNIDLANECPRQLTKTQCAISAPADAYAQFSAGHSVILFDLADEVLSFEPSATVEHFDNGDVVISGIALNASGDEFTVNLEYTDSNANGQAKRELIDSAYLEQAGPVDPATWRYLDNFSGNIVGTSGSFNEVELMLSQRGSSSQIGEGANGKNVGFGLSNWLTAVVTQAPDSSGLEVGDTFNGDVNIDIKDDCSVIVDPPAPTVDAVDDVYSIPLRAPLRVNVLDNDTVGDPAAIVSFDPASIPSGFTFTLDGNLIRNPLGFGLVFPRIVSFEYTLTHSDGTSDTATVTITIEQTPNA